MMMVVVAVFVQRRERHSRGLLRLAKKKLRERTRRLLRSEPATMLEETGEGEFADKKKDESQESESNKNKQAPRGARGEASDRGGNIQGPMVSRPAIERGSRSAC